MGYNKKETNVKMGLTKAQLQERAYKKLKECMDKYCTPVKKSKVIKSKWDKYPITAKDICVLGAYITKDNKILLGDYDSEKDSYTENQYRFAEEFEREYLDSVTKQITDFEADLARFEV